MCTYCGEPAGDVDHIIPLSKGGSNQATNLTTACVKCNSRKKDKLLEAAGMKPLKGCRSSRRVLALSTVAFIFSVCEKTVRNMVAAGEIGAERMNGEVMISVEEVEAFIAKLEPYRPQRANAERPG